MGDGTLPPGFQLCPHLFKDLCTVGPLVFVVLEAVEEDGEFDIAATPEVRAPGE